MKKTILTSLCAIAFALGSMAQDITGSITIQLESESAATNEMYIFEASDFAEGIDTENVADFFENTTNTANVNVYAIYDAKRYSQFAARNIKDLPIGIITNREAANKQNYTFKFGDLDGRTMKLYDKVTGTETNMTDGGSYSFTVNTENCPSYVAGTNVVINDRFVVEMAAPEYTICHQYGALAITGASGKTVVVKDAQGVAQITEVLSSHYASIDLSSLSAGQYKVVVALDEGDKEYIIQVQ